MLFAYSDGISDKKGAWQAAWLVHGVQDALFCSVNSSQQSEPLSLIFSIQLGGGALSFDYNWCLMCRFVVSLSSTQPGASLEQTHIFVLAHILRRPIIVYGVKYYKSFRGETLGYTRFQGEAAGVALWTRGEVLLRASRCSVRSLFIKQTVILWKNYKRWSDTVSCVTEYVYLS